MKEKQSVLHIQLKTSISADHKGREVKYLDFSTEHSKIKFDSFVEHLSHNQTVDVFYDANVDNGTLAQLAKIHKCIREIAIDTGNVFEDMKFEVKHKSGLCFSKPINGVNFMVCKSFADCSKDELGLVIETIINLGDELNINFR